MAIGGGASGANPAVYSAAPSSQNLASFAAPPGMTPYQVAQLAMSIGNGGAQSSQQHAAANGSLGPLLQAIFGQPNATTQAPAPQSPYAAASPTPASIAAARATPAPVATQTPAAAPPAPSGNPMDPYGNVTAAEDE